MIFTSIAIGSIGIAIILVEILSIGARLKKLFKINPYKSIKPFDCIMCMSFWTSLILGLVFAETELDAIAGSSAAVIGVYLLERFRVI